MPKYIDANLLKAEFTGNFTKDYGVPLIKSIIDQQTAADVQEVKHAKWVYSGEYVQCSNCEHVTDDFCYDDEMNMILPHYCSNCGARMEEDS